MLAYPNDPIVRLNLHASSLAGVAALSLLALNAAPSLAQAASPQADAPDGSIVVTAQRRPDTQINVPTALTVLQSDALTTVHAVKLADYFTSVPGLNLQDNGNGFKQITIRGLTSGAFTTPTVGTYIDETPIGSSTALAFGDQLVPDLDPTELKQIEILKGPQGTLYGANTLGGLLKYVTVKPDASKLSGSLSADALGIPGGGAGYGVRGAINLPLVKDKLALRVSGFDREDPGYIDDPFKGTRNINRVYAYGGKVALRWTPAAGTTVDLSAILQDQHSPGSSEEDFDVATGRPLFGSLEQQRLPGADVYRERFRIYNGTIVSDLGFATLTSSTSYAINHYSGTQDLSSQFTGVVSAIFGVDGVGVPMVQRFGTKKFTQELRLAGTVGKLDWLVGGFYTHERSTAYQRFDTVDFETAAAVDLPNLLTYYVGSTYREYAGFGDLTYHFTNRFSIQAGVRYSHNSQDAHEINSGIINVTNDLRLRSHEGVATFLVTPQFKLTGDISLYGRVSSGYRPGGPNIVLTSTVPATFGSDKTMDYEIGTKLFALDRKLYFDLSVYYIKWRDIQLSAHDQFNNLYTTNGGNAVSKGFEIAATYRPVSGLSLSGNLAYNDAHLTSTGPNGIYAPAGTRLPYSPKWSATLGAEYGFRLTDDLKAVLGADASYAGSRLAAFTSSAAQLRPELPDYTTVNAHIGLERGPYSATLFARNIGNARGILTVLHTSLGTDTRYAYTIIQPRTVGATFGVKF